MNNKSLVGIIFIAIGVLLALKFLNIMIGPIIAFLLPFILIVCGVIGLRNGRKVIGSIFLIIGLVMLLGNLGQVLTIVLAIVLIGIGIAFLNGKSNRYY